MTSCARPSRGASAEPQPTRAAPIPVHSALSAPLIEDAVHCALRHRWVAYVQMAPADQKPMSLMDQLNAMSSTAAKAADDVAAEGAKTDAKMGRVRRKSKDLEDTINAVAAAAAVPEPETAKPEHLKRMDDY